MHARHFLVDCGEGTQMRMQQFGVKASRIDHIFISHLHGDHFFGLVGLISSMALLGRTKELTIYCPAGLKEMIDLQLQWETGFTIHYRILEETETTVLLKGSNFEVACFPVFHSVPTHGFIFREKKRKRVLLPDRCRELEIPKYYYARLAAGEDYLSKDGVLIKNEAVTDQGHPDKVYAYCADTRFAPEICTHLEGVDLLYHESTYLDVDREKAMLRMHTTAKEAAEIARRCKAGKLLLGHFSSKYRELDLFLEEAKTIYEPVEIAMEGMTFEL